jgi:hypothetical protein
VHDHKYRGAPKDRHRGEILSIVARAEKNTVNCQRLCRLREREYRSERFVPHFAEQDGKF